MILPILILVSFSNERDKKLIQTANPNDVLRAEVGDVLTMWKVPQYIMHETSIDISQGSKIVIADFLPFGNDRTLQRSEFIHKGAHKEAYHIATIFSNATYVIKPMESEKAALESYEEQNIAARQSYRYYLNHFAAPIMFHYLQVAIAKNEKTGQFYLIENFLKYFTKEPRDELCIEFEKFSEWSRQNGFDIQDPQGFCEFNRYPMFGYAQHFLMTDAMVDCYESDLHRNTVRKKLN